VKEPYKAGCLRDSLLRVSKTWASEKVHEKHYFISLEALLLPLRWHYWYLLGGASSASLGEYCSRKVGERKAFAHASLVPPLRHFVSSLECGEHGAKQGARSSL